MVGESIMIAPVYQPNVFGRSVYLPEDMTMLRFRSLTDFDTCELKKGHHYLDVALEEVLVFVRKDRLLPVGFGAESTAELGIGPFTFYGTGTSYTLYDTESITTLKK